MVLIKVTTKEHRQYAKEIAQLIEESAKVRGTGIAKRDPDYLKEKIKKGQAVIATDLEKLVGFCYIESWSNHNYVANSGLIVHPDYRGQGIAKKIKKKVFTLSKKLFPEAKIFGLTTNGSVMSINSSLGYKPTIYKELTQDEDFWKGCMSCVNYDILTRNKREMCMCTAMIYDPKKKPKKG